MKALFDIGFEQARSRAAFRNQLEPGSTPSISARDGSQHYYFPRDELESLLKL
jgi:hypothetical protein